MSTDTPTIPPDVDATAKTAKEFMLSRSWALILPFLKPIHGLIFDAEISEIMVNGSNGAVFVERSGVVTLTDVKMQRESLLAAVKSIARNLGDDIHETRPILDARLDDGSRVAVVIPPVSLGGITMTIRKFAAKHFTLDDLIARGSIAVEAAGILVGAVQARRNILISGGTGTGKTTILNILSNAIPADDRVLLIEDTAEIQITVPNLVRFEAKRPREGYEGTPIRALLKAALRHRPDRIIVGEIRDGAAYDLLQALNTGHSGSMSTVHADSARGALTRFEHLVLESGVELPHKAIKASIAEAVHCLVQIERNQGQRFVAQVIHLAGYDPDTDDYKYQSLYSRPRTDDPHAGDDTWWSRNTYTPAR